MPNMFEEASAYARWMGESEDSAYPYSCPDCRKAGVECHCIWNGSAWIPALITGASDE